MLINRASSIITKKMRKRVKNREIKQEKKLSMKVGELLKKQMAEKIGGKKIVIE
jgi:hypothetical protein